MARHTIASVRNESKLKVGFVSLSGLALWLGGYYLFFRGFSWLKQFQADALGAGEMFTLGEILMARLLSIFALALFFMLIFSNVLIAFSTLYKAHEVRYLIQAPMSYGGFFLARFIECVSFSSWASAFLGTPLILAYGVVHEAPVAYLVASALFYVPFVTIPAAIGAVIAMILVRVFPRLRMWASVALAVVSILAIGWYAQQRITAERLGEDNVVIALFEATNQTQSPYLPSYWATAGVLSAGTGNYGDAFFYLLLLASNAAFATMVAVGAAQWLFYPGYSYLVGQDRTRIRKMDRGPFAWAARLLRWVRNPHRVITLKDIKLFWRDPAQWSQFVIFFGLMTLYIAFIRPGEMQRSNDMWRTWIICMNIGACSLILATLTTRFVFPLISLEGRRFWILGLAPLTFRQLIWQKFWLSVITTSLFTVGLVIISCIRLGVEPEVFALSLLSIVATNFGLSGLAVGLGAIYPNFQEDNPARIVSGLGGTLNFLLSVAYLTIIVGAQTVLLQSRVADVFTTHTQFQWAYAGTVAFMIGLSLVAWLGPLWLGLRNLNRLEF